MHAQSPQKATYQVDTSAGDVKHLYGQGRPMAWQATGDGADYSSGEESDGGGGTVMVESRMYFDGTVDSGATTGELSRMTDAREKGRIGILGSALSYAGSYGRVTSESIGRDLNPLGRGNGRAYVAGALNLGRITPRLSRGYGAVGTGSSVNNCGQGTPIDPDPSVNVGAGEGGCTNCCPPWTKACGNADVATNKTCEICDYDNLPDGMSCRTAECQCRECAWERANEMGCSQKTRYEVMCEDCCCEGCPCSVNGRSGSPPVGTTGNGGYGITGSPPGYVFLGSDIPEQYKPEGNSDSDYDWWIGNIKVHKNCWKYMIGPEGYLAFIEGYRMVDEALTNGSCMCIGKVGADSDLQKCLRNAFTNANKGNTDILYIRCNCSNKRFPALGHWCPRSKHIEVCPEVWATEGYSAAACNIAGVLLHETLHFCKDQLNGNKSASYGLMNGCSTHDAVTRRCE